MAIIQRLISKMEDRVIEFPDERQRYLVVKELVQSVVDIGSNLLDISQSEAWQDLSDTEQREAASVMLYGLERNVRLLADTQTREGRFSHAQNNICKIFFRRYLVRRKVVFGGPGFIQKSFSSP